MVSDDGLTLRLRQILDAEPGVTEKKMFGGHAFLVNGHMAIAASSKGGLMLRVAPEQSEELLAELLADDRITPFVMRGRELDGWVRIDVGADVAEDDLRRWTSIGVDCATALPPR